MTSGIYTITNTVNGKQYIGSARDIGVRWQSHRGYFRNGTHHSAHLQRAWDKYGADAFRFDVLECVPEIARLIEREQFHLDERYARTGNHGYNVSPTASSCLGVRHSEGTRAYMGALSRARNANPTPAMLATRAKAVAAMGRPEVKMKAKAGRRNRPPTARELEHWTAFSKATIERNQALKKQPHELKTHAPVMEGVKTCRWCGQEKSVVKFPPNKHLAGGRANHCYECAKSRDKRRVNRTVDEEALRARREAFSQTMRGRKQSPEWVARRTASRSATLARKREERLATGTLPGFGT